MLTKGHGKRGHIVVDTNVSPFARARNICCGHKFCVRDTKNVSDFVQKHFVSATNVSQFAQPKKHHEQQCVRNSVQYLKRLLWRLRRQRRLKNESIFTYKSRDTLKSFNFAYNCQSYRETESRTPQ